MPQEARGGRRGLSRGESLSSQAWQARRHLARGDRSHHSACGRQVIPARKRAPHKGHGRGGEASKQVAPDYGRVVNSPSHQSF